MKGASNMHTICQFFNYLLKESAPSKKILFHGHEAARGGWTFATVVPGLMNILDASPEFLSHGNSSDS